VAHSPEDIWMRRIPDGGRAVHGREDLGLDFEGLGAETGSDRAAT